MTDAKKVDPETRRTLPVLTKPDQIDAGAETSVKELLLGEKTEGFQQGFHMVKSRGQAALNSGETIEQGLQGEIFRTLVYQFIEEDWSIPCIDMVETITEILKTSASELVEKETTIASFPRLKRLVPSLVAREIDDSMKEARKEVERVVKREQIPYTQREAAFQHLQSLQKNRIMNSTSGAFKGYNSTMNVSTAKQCLETAILKDLKEKSVEECMAEELEERLSAYGKVAFERIIDIVPMICRDGMVHLPVKARRAFGNVTDSDLEQAIVLSSSRTNWKISRGVSQS